MGVVVRSKKKGAEAPKTAKKTPPPSALHNCSGTWGGRCGFWGVGPFFPKGRDQRRACHKAKRLARLLPLPGTTQTTHERGSGLALLHFLLQKGEQPC